MTSSSRRRFLQQSIGAAAGTGLIGKAAGSAASSQDRVAGANRRIRIGVIGCGGMGTADVRAMARLGAQVVALCDVDDAQSAHQVLAVTSSSIRVVYFSNASVSVENWMIRSCPWNGYLRHTSTCRSVTSITL